jgi:hypothetical protein
MLGALACNGQIGQMETDPSRPGGGGPGGPGGPGDPSMQPGSSGSCTHAGRSVIRRLTKTEFSNTVHDLFGVTPAATAMLPQESMGASGFDNDAQGLTMSSQLLDPYITAAENVATEIITSSPQKFLICQPSPQLTADACARKVLETELPAMFRRPVTPDEVSDLLAVYTANQADGFAPAMKLVLEAALLSPNFLYLTYSDPAAATSADVYSLDNWELASRLSYFFWSSTPDSDLLVAAKAGTLAQPAVYDAQVRRMLTDPKGLALIDAFSSEWLGTSQLPTMTRNPMLYPAWNTALSDAMLAETQAFMRSLLTEDKSLRELLTANYSYLDPTLAAYYQIPGVTGTGLQKVTLPPASHRGGLLTQATFLTLTATSERSNPIRRGRWVLIEALCGELPPKPAMVPTLPNTGAAEGNVRMQLAEHRTNPACAGCHTLMDPIGLGLENFDAIGAYRQTYRDGSAIDPAGKLPSGTTFSTPAELEQALVASGDFDRCMTRKLLSYAVNRNLTADDQCVADALAKADVGPDQKLSTVLTGIAHSAPFQQREGGGQ